MASATTAYRAVIVYRHWISSGAAFTSIPGFLDSWIDLQLCCRSTLIFSDLRLGVTAGANFWDLPRLASQHHTNYRFKSLDAPSYPWSFFDLL